MGNDYYVTNEHRVWEDGRTQASGEVFGYNEITRQYYERYRLPVMHTETNIIQGPKGGFAPGRLKNEVDRFRRGRCVSAAGSTGYRLAQRLFPRTPARCQVQVG